MGSSVFEGRLKIIAVSQRLNIKGDDQAVQTMWVSEILQLLSFDLQSNRLVSKLGRQSGA